MGTFRALFALLLTCTDEQLKTDQNLAMHTLPAKAVWDASMANETPWSEDLDALKWWQECRDSTLRAALHYNGVLIIFEEEHFKPWLAKSQTSFNLQIKGVPQGLAAAPRSSVPSCTACVSDLANIAHQFKTSLPSQFADDMIMYCSYSSKIQHHLKLVLTYSVNCPGGPASGNDWEGSVGEHWTLQGHFNGNLIIVHHCCTYWATITQWLAMDVARLWRKLNWEIFPKDAKVKFSLFKKKIGPKRFCPIFFLNKLNFTFASFGKISQRSCTWSQKGPSTSGNSIAWCHCRQLRVSWEAHAWMKLIPSRLK